MTPFWPLDGGPSKHDQNSEVLPFASKRALLVLLPEVAWIQIHKIIWLKPFLVMLSTAEVTNIWVQMTPKVLKLCQKWKKWNAGNAQKKNNFTWNSTGILSQLTSQLECSILFFYFWHIFGHLDPHRGVKLESMAICYTDSALSVEILCNTVQSRVFPKRMIYYIGTQWTVAFAWG